MSNTTTRKGFWKNASYVGLSMVAWWIPSLGLTAANKMIFSDYQFPFPVTVTCFHFSITSVILMTAFHCCKFNLAVPTCSWRRYKYHVVPIAVFAATDIVFSNAAYSYLPLSVLTVIKSSVVIFVYFAALIFGIEKFNCAIFSVGVFIVACIAWVLVDKKTANEIKDAVDMDVHPIGILFAGIGIITAALRWVVVQLQCKSYSPMQLMYLTQPASAVILIPFIFIVEGRKILDRFADYEWQQSDNSNVIWIIVVCSPMAFLLLLAEYYVVKLTSSVTITVAGVGKEIFVIFLGVMFWHESLSFSQMCGIMLSVVGILIYSYLRHKNAPRYSQDLPEHALFDFITMDEDDLSDEENEWAPEEYDRRSVFKIPRLSRGNTGGSNLAEMASPEDTPGEAPPLEVLSRHVTPGDRLERGFHAIGKAHAENEIQLAEKRQERQNSAPNGLTVESLSNPQLMVHRSRSNTPSDPNGRRGSEAV